ncbi:pilus assembly protein [Ectopseudomonas oleovorans]|uniref:pilus assembly protein n=1 Tax=Ectopseudomonas oleovorans TaxID=301 RepID=UPI003F1A2C40
MHSFRLHSRAKTLSYAAFGIALLSAADAYATVSQSPLSLTIGVPPNLILTLDESGSMSWGYVPDSVLGSVISGSNITRLYAANAYNPMYYNPNTDYVIPPFFDVNGEEITLSTQFSAAPINGFRPEDGTLDLSSYYRPTGREYRMPLGNHNRLNGPAGDFQVTKTTSNNQQPDDVESEAGIVFRLTRPDGTRTCVIQEAGPVLDNTHFTCSRDGNTYTARTPAYYYSYDDSLTGCSDSTADASCYKLVFVEEEEEENFAIWYSFYRTRALATLSATSLAFAQLSPAVRLSWQDLARCTTLNGGSASRCKDNKFRQYDSLHKGQFYSWLKDIYFDSGTPLPAAMKRAGEFLKEDVAWHKYPNSRNSSDRNTTANTYACRASYHILMTDGMWNANASAPSDFRHDAATFDLPDGRSYSQRRPYYDTTEKTLADLAMHYWATDLNTSLDNDVPAYIPFKSGDTTTDYWDARNDPATWQHMTNFIMGLGLTSSLNSPGIPWSGSTHKGAGYEALVAGTKDWPEASSSSANNVYDLWHAAINSRGEFFSVDSPEAMVQAFDDILSRIADRKSTAARPAINSGQISTDEDDNGIVRTVSYQTSYASDDNWSGDVKRFEKGWNSQTNTFETREIWSAKNQVPGAASRRIKIAGNDNNGLAVFTWANAGASGTVGTLAYFLSRDPENGNVVDSKGSQRLDYLRGDRTGEGTTFRQRSGVLGDFYSSTPAVVSGPRYLVNFSDQLEGNQAYSTFAQKIKQRQSRVYVGGNDGMLHAFNADTGVEEFAFIPTAVFPKLNKLTGTNYSHEFYVDGPPTVADVFNGSEWRTILVGTLKAGGKSIFALDITEPGKEELLWEFDDSRLGESNVKMGYSFAQPTIARLHTGKWAVVIGNGYESEGHTSGKAALFIIDALEGNLLKSLEVQGTVGVANGLSTAKLGDFNADGVADYAYAGDLQGNVWRFDLLRSGRSESAPFTREDDGESAINDFEVAYGGKPLFSATSSNNGSRQPITSAPSLVRHPTGTGYLVIFGTGKFFETSDKEGDKSMPQSVYGIWDKQTLGEAASNPNISRSSLQKQEITNQVTVAADGSSRQGLVISNNAVDWYGSDTQSAQNGWWLDLRQSEGEMVIENMSQLGRTIFFQTLIPNDDPCGDGASNWTFAINPFTGGRTPHNAFDYTPTSDVGTNNISAIRQDGEGGGTLSQNSDNSFQYCTGQECTNIYPDPSSIGRQSWRRVGFE